MMGFHPHLVVCIRRTPRRRTSHRPPSTSYGLLARMTLWAALCSSTNCTSSSFKRSTSECRCGWRVTEAVVSVTPHKHKPPPNYDQLNFFLVQSVITLIALCIPSLHTHSAGNNPISGIIICCCMSKLLSPVFLPVYLLRPVIC